MYQKTEKNNNWIKIYKIKKEIRNKKQQNLKWNLDRLRFWRCRNSVRDTGNNGKHILDFAPVKIGIKIFLFTPK